MICPRCKRRFPSDERLCPDDGTQLVLEDTVVEPGRGQGSAAADLQPGDRVGDYEITGNLGHGGMARVYAAVHPLIGKRVAVKVLHPQYSSDPQVAPRFLQEARAVNQADSERIVDIFAYGELPDARLYLVMDLVEGTTLHDLIKERAPLPLTLAVPILVEIARALEAAHAVDIVHRDLKPQNVVVRLDEGGGLRDLKLLDFGVAKLTRTDIPELLTTRTGVSVGSPYFMAPEQLRGGPVGPAADIYALGVTAFQMLTRRLPFNGTSYAELASQHLETPPPELRSLRDDLPSALDQLIMGCLAKEAAGRPGSMAEVIDVLQKLELEARPTPPRRRKGLVPLICIALALALGLAVLAVLLLDSGNKRPAPASPAPQTAPQADTRGLDAARAPVAADGRKIGRRVRVSPGKSLDLALSPPKKPAPSPTAATHRPRERSKPPRCNYGEGGWVWREGPCRRRITRTSSHDVRHRTMFYRYDKVRLIGGRMPRCLSTRLGGFDGLRARLATSAMKNLAACHDRHVRCDPAAWSITWKLTLRADGSVTDVRATRAPPPLMECVTKTLRSFTWETCARTVTLSLILTTMRGRATPACVQ